MIGYGHFRLPRQLSHPLVFSTNQCFILTAVDIGAVFKFQGAVGDAIVVLQKVFDSRPELGVALRRFSSPHMGFHRLVILIQLPDV